MYTDTYMYIIHWLFVKFTVLKWLIYIGWSDVTYLWSQCNHHFVGQHIVLCVVKWWRFVKLLESNWIGWFKKMSVLSLSYWESDIYWCQNNTHFAELTPQNARKQLIWRNYVTVTLCITSSVGFLVLVGTVNCWCFRLWVLRHLWCHEHCISMPWVEIGNPKF